MTVWEVLDPVLARTDKTNINYLSMSTKVLVGMQL